MANGDVANVNGSLPPWAKVASWLISTVGVPTFLLLWFAGAFDGYLPSPAQAAIEKHHRETVPIMRLVCKGVWKGNDQMTNECDK